jgi:hypothetical protein
MKKATSRRRVGPTAASLRELPEIDFARYRVLRNPFAAIVAREGIELRHDGPSAGSLKEMPEADFARLKSRRSSYAGRARRELIQLAAGRGRPRRGSEVGPTPARSVRLTLAVWASLEDEARSANSTVHAVLRQAVTQYLETAVFLRNVRVVGHVLWSHWQQMWAEGEAGQPDSQHLEYVLHAQAFGELHSAVTPVRHHNVLDLNRAAQDERAAIDVKRLVVKSFN